MAYLKWVGTDSGNEGDFNVAANWYNLGSGVVAAAPPSNGDSLLFTDSSQSMTTNLDTLGTGGTNVMALLTIRQSYTGSIVGSAGEPFVCESTKVKIGQHSGPGTPTGSPSISLNLGDQLAGVTVYNTGTAADGTSPALKMYGDNASNTITVLRGKVGINTEVNTDGKYSKITVAYVDKPNTDAYVWIGTPSDDTGIEALPNVEVTGGVCYLNASTTAAVTCRGGATTIQGNTTHVDIKATGGTVYYDSEGEISGGFYASDAGIIDLARGLCSVTFAAADVFVDRGGVFKWDPGLTTFEVNPLPSDTTAGAVTYTCT